MSIRLSGKLPARLLRGDRVQTVSGRHGRIQVIFTDGDSARVLWDDGEDFSIRLGHLILEEEKNGS